MINPSGGIMCAGKGTRLHRLGMKPLVLVEDRSLIHRALDFFSEASINDVTLAAGKNADEIGKHLEPQFHRTKIVRDITGTGTGAAVYELLKHANDDGIVIATVDTIATRNVISKLIQYVSQLESDLVAVFVVTTFVHDEKPIWISHSEEKVYGFSKSLNPTGTVFGNIRWLSKMACDDLLRREQRADGKDSLLMQGLIDRFQDRVGFYVHNPIFDVDTPEDCRLASEWLRENVDER